MLCKSLPGLQQIPVLLFGTFWNLFSQTFLILSLLNPCLWNQGYRGLTALGYGKRTQLEPSTVVAVLSFQTMCVGHFSDHFIHRIKTLLIVPQLFPWLRGTTSSFPVQFIYSKHESFPALSLFTSW